MIRIDDDQTIALGLIDVKEASGMKALRPTRFKISMTVAVVIGGLMTSGSAAQAHVSTYCGHDKDGTLNTTFFMSHYGNPNHGQVGHGHWQYHDMLWGFDHYDNRECVA